MSDSVRDSIYEAIASIRLIDPHTHINPHAPASTTLADLLGYHYYTELAHSAGMPKDQIEEDGLPPRKLVERLVMNLSPLENTAQYRWLIEICRVFFGFEGDRLDASNWESVYDAAEQKMSIADWPQMVLDQSNVEAVFLTNDFDDALSGFDTETYIPCLRTDDLVFHLSKLQTRQRLAACTGIELDGSLLSLRESLKHRFEHFVKNGARACAISLPPSFEPIPVSDGRAATALDQVLKKGITADESHQLALSRRVFWTLAELCDEYGLPFDLMIGVNRGVYAGGVFQGQDLFDSRVSLIQYRELFNAFPDVKFPISVLASVTNQELVSYAWIFPNVITNGHWWYSNTPSFIARDAAARLEAVPQTKQIGYYSDAYKLEFVWPKFDMYRHVLSGILADHFVGQCGWSEERAVELGRQVLRDNVDEIFPRRRVDPQAETWAEDRDGADAADPNATWTSGLSSSLAAGAIGTVEVGQPSPADEPTSEAEADFVDEGEGGEILSTLIIDEEDDEELSTGDTIKIETVLEEIPDEDKSDPPVGGITMPSPDPDATLMDRSPVSDEPADLDPLPTDDEIKAVDVSDVEIIDMAVERSGPAPDAIAAEVDPEPLDVGDLLGDEESAKESSPDIRMLRGESHFQPDEDSLQVRPDPMTGELVFPAENSDDSTGDDKQDSITDTWSTDVDLANLDIDASEEGNKEE